MAKLLTLGLAVAVILVLLCQSGLEAVCLVPSPSTTTASPSTTIAGPSTTTAGPSTATASNAIASGGNASTFKPASTSTHKVYAHARDS
ncbi:unnamed protein product [Closterium sp. NIES-53]